jgi:hypothetical protein
MALVEGGNIDLVAVLIEPGEQGGQAGPSDDGELRSTTNDRPVTLASTSTVCFAVISSEAISTRSPSS